MTPVVDDRPAGLGRRFLAVAVDQAVALLLGGGVVATASLRAAAAVREGAPVADPVPGPLLAGATLLLAAVGVAQWLLHGRYGWTLGRLLLGVRTVDVHARRPVGPWRVLLRELVVAAGAVACLVGQWVVLLSPLLDRTGRRRGWHDRVAGVEVLRATAGAPAGARGRAPRPSTAASGAGEDDGLFRPPAPPTPADADAGGGAPVPPPRVDRPDRPAASTPTPAGGLVLAPLHPQRAAPDLDTRALPVVRTDPALAYGLAPELELTRPAPPRADVVDGPGAPARRGLRVTFDDGRALTVERHALVGRNPSPTPDVQVVRVADPGRSVSKTHLQLLVDDAGAWVVDRGSTNGTVVTLPDGAQVVCRVDHPVRLREGAVVVFGDRSLRVVGVPSGASAPR